MSPVVSAETKQRFWKEHIYPAGYRSHMPLIPDINEALEAGQWDRASMLLTHRLGLVTSVDKAYGRMMFPWPKEEAASAVNALGVCSAAQGKRSEAAKLLEYAVKLDPANVLAAQNLVNCAVSGNARVMRCSPELLAQFAYAA